MDTSLIVKYYDYLMKIAIAKCKSQVEAEDLVGDTMLAVCLHISKGNKIKHLKTYLLNTMLNKYNDNLRKKYHMPTIINLNEMIVASNDEEELFSLEEKANIRKELNHLAYINREVLIRYYFGNQSIDDIARSLNIPTNTVKSRLLAGRNKIKEGYLKMEKEDNCLPGKLYLSYFGVNGIKNEPVSLVENDLIAQNILIIAYEKPLSIPELSRKIGIPSAYLEPIIKKLVDGELMVAMPSGKIYTDFIITKPQDKLNHYKEQLAFANKYFREIWNIISLMSKNIESLSFVKKMEDEIKNKLNRYAILKALQDFQFSILEKPTTFINRKDGGKWFASALEIEAGYDMEEYNETSNYLILGGHRTLSKVIDNTSIHLYEFDTSLYDCPSRYGNDFDLYCKYIIPLLWSIYTENSLTNNDEIPNDFINYIPSFEQLGILKKQNNKILVDIPILTKNEYETISEIIKEATRKIKDKIGNEFFNFALKNKTTLPKHLSYVPDLLLYNDATCYFAMAIIRKAFESKLHLCNVTYCCPPVVLVYNKNN